MQIENKHIILFDNDCPLCNHWVSFVLKHDKSNQFLFAPLQSDFGQDFLIERKLEHIDFSTIYLFSPKNYYFIKSQAVLKIFDLIGGIYKPISLLKFFPQSISDYFYDIISRNRKGVKFKNCPTLTPEQREKFI